MWQTIAFAPPGSLLNIHASAAEVAAAAPGELDSSAGRLAAVNGTAAMTANPVAAIAALCDGLRDTLIGLMSTGGKFVCVHPYRHPVGDRRYDYAYLTPADAVSALAAKLADVADPPPAGTLGALTLMIRETGHAAFRASLAAFNAVFPVTGLQLAQRRAGWLATLESDKLIQAAGPKTPAWKSGDPRRHAAVAGMDRATGGLLALAEGYAAENVRPEDELAALIAEKTQRVADLESAWNDFAASLQGDAGSGLYLTGDAASIRRQLLSSDPPAATYKLTACACWVAPEANLTLLREVFGL